MPIKNRSKQTRQEDENRSPDGKGPGKSPKGEPKGPPKPPPRSMFGWMAILLVGLMVAMWFTSQANQASSVVSWQEFETLFRNGEIADNSVVVRDTSVHALRLVSGKEHSVKFAFNATGREFYLTKVDKMTEGRFRDSPGPGLFWQILFNPFTLTIALILFFWFVILRGVRSMSGGGGMLGNFGKSRHRVLAKESTGVTLKDVAGVEEAKDEVGEIIEFLRNPKKFMRLGARVPRGVLLVGEPGCGKTLLAKAIAGEADVPFFSISGSDFVEMFVGVGASRVRDLFKQAKESSPCIIFLDEIDAVGRRRGSGFSSGGHDEREQTLNAILVEMDGFESTDQIIVIAATNRADVLDPALLRPGRFDRQVVVPMPDIKGRLEILKVHARKVKMGPTIDLERVAKATPTFSGADLAAIINEAAIAATLLDKDYIEQADLEEARDKVKYGRSRKSRVIEEEERVATAYHEAGHAVLQAIIPGADPLHKVTILPRGQALGATFSLPEKDRHGYGLKWLKATMRVVCGGRIAEERKTSEVSSGASMDITQLTMLARAMVLEWGMSERLGFVRYAGVDSRDMFMAPRDYSDETARIIDEEVKRFADEAFRDAERVLNEHWESVERVAIALLKHETLTADEVHRLMRGEDLGKPTVSDLLEAEARKARAPASGEKPTRKPATGDDAGPGLLPRPA